MLKKLLAIALFIILALQMAIAHEDHKKEEKKDQPETKKPQKKKSEKAEDHPGNQGLTLEQRKTAEGRYHKLLRRIKVPQDKDAIVNQPLYVEYGYLDHDYLPAQKEYYGHKNIPAGFWVYVYPYWYIWAGQKFY